MDFEFDEAIVMRNFLQEKMDLIAERFSRGVGDHQDIATYDSLAQRVNRLQLKIDRHINRSNTKPFWQFWK